MHLDSKILIQPSCTLVKVKDVTLEGEEISGRFDSELQQLTNPVAVCESFLNCRPGKDVLRFTKRYGPLFHQYGSLLHQTFEITAPKDLPFSFQLSKWIEFQYDMRVLWGAEADSWHFGVGKDHDLRPVEEWFSLSRKGSQFMFADLSRLICFFIHVLPAERQRACARPDCGKRFFANHLKQTYCGSLECAHWGQLQAKKACWNRNKEKYMAQR